MAEFASKGVAGSGLGLGIAGTALGLLNGGAGLLGGGWGRGVCSENTPVSRYELGLQQEIAAKDSRIGLLESNIYTDQKLADVYDRLTTKMNGMKDEQAAVNMAQAAYNAGNTAAVSVIQSQVAQLMGLTKLVIPNGSVCPGWGAVKVVPETTTASAGA